MLGRRNVVAGVLIFAPFAVAYGCSPFRTDSELGSSNVPSPPGEGGASSSSSSGSGPDPSDGKTPLPHDDAGAPDGATLDAGPEYDTKLADGGNLHCIDFTQTAGSFTPSGSATRNETDGFVITVANGSQNKIRRTFVRPNPFTVTDLTLDLRIAINGTIQGQDYVDAITQIHGENGATDPYDSFEITNSGFDVNVWPSGQSGQFDHSYGVIPSQFDLKKVNAPFTLTTLWSPGGRFYMGPAHFELAASVAQLPAPQKYTLEIGGARSGGTPASMIFKLRGLCLSFR